MTRIGFEEKQKEWKIITPIEDFEKENDHWDCPICGVQYAAMEPIEEIEKDHEKIHNFWCEFVRGNIWIAPQKMWKELKNEYMKMSHDFKNPNCVEIILDFLVYNYSLTCIQLIEKGNKEPVPSFREYVDEKLSRNFVHGLNDDIKKDILLEINNINNIEIIGTHASNYIPPIMRY